ncbi:hypothetical protein LZ558_20985 (plasmid) [Methylobacter sp. YRD-M1]|nr:hypothetical protein LZ558_20985 [Methylobacter sp. YRD-M1]
MGINNFQRVGSVSNAHVGRDFESIAKEHFRQQGILLGSSYSVPVGVGTDKKSRQFDLGSGDPPILVECKSHRWTTGGNVPSAKITVWNEAMYYFHLAPDSYKKVLFVLRDVNKKRGKSLAEYYIKNYRHLIPKNVEILEYDEESNNVIVILTTVSSRSGLPIALQI